MSNLLISRCLKKKIYILLTGILVLHTCLGIPLFAQQAAHKALTHGKIKYLSDELIVKLRPARQHFSLAQVSALLQKSGSSALITSARDIFSSQTGPRGVFSLALVEGVDPLVAAKKISGNPDVEWAEPRYIYEVDYLPNDSLFVNQWALSKISAANAWDITKGDTSVVIGIIDTGVDWDHPDIYANVWRNSKEITGNGIDDDRNGFRDDIIGWDFGGISGAADNDPAEDRPDHGTHVAGIASAVTNNARGIASIGYSCRIMPVKASQDNFRSESGKPYIVYGYEAIAYAAANGCKVINCSWGGYSYSHFGQETVNYATEKGALVIAAAGNENSSDRHYPSSFANVISVASSSQGDLKSSFSNYGNEVDVSAPGESILSTWMNDTYIYSSGTSMAAPLAAGLAGLIAARFPQFSPLQIGEQLRVTCDDITPQNPSFRGALGRGRISARRALSVTSAIACRAYEIAFDDSLGDNDGAAEPGELIRLRVKFRNYLSPAATLNIGLESVSQYASVVQTNYTISSVASLDSFSNALNPFSFRVHSGTPYNAELRFALNFLTPAGLDEQWFSITANPSYATQKGNDIAVTITSKGNFGFADYPDNLQGDGLSYKDSPSLLFEGALIAGTSAGRISNTARNANQGKAQDQDFTTVSPFIISVPGKYADMEGNCTFHDGANPSGALGIKSLLRSYSFAGPENSNFVILRYTVTNTGASPLNNFSLGLFTDWDLTPSGADDLTAYDAAGKLGYCEHFGGNQNTKTGVALLGGHTPQYYAILNEGGDGGFSIYDGFSDAEKWLSISNGIQKNRAGAGDVSFVMSSGPFSLKPNASVDIGFALLADTSLARLRAAAAQADSQYAKMSKEPPAYSLPFLLEQNKPNPARNSTAITFASDEEGFATLIIYDILGREILTPFRGAVSHQSYSVRVNTSLLPAGVYMYVLRINGKEAVRKMTVIH